MLRIVVRQRRQLQGKGVVAGCQHKAVGGNDGGVDNLPQTRHGGWGYGFAIDPESRQLHLGMPVAFLDVLRLEPCDATQSAKNHLTIGSHEGGTVAELVGLQAVVHKVVAGLARLGVQTAQAVVGRYPEIALMVLLDAGDAVVCQAALHGVHMGP